MTRARDLAAFVSNADGDIKFDTDTLFIDSSTNRVGLGTNAPSVQLDIESTAPTIRLTDSDASGTPESEVSGAGGDITIKADRDNEKASSLIGFEVDGTERMRIDASGNVGIGVNDPDAVLDVSGGSNKLGILRVVQRVSGAAAYGLDIGLDPTLGDPVFSKIENDVAAESFRIRRTNGALISSGGITLGTASGAYAAANTLDDYEEGTWTPQVTIDASNVTTSATGAVYTKIGRQVFLHASINFSSGTSNGLVNIEGAPFAPSTSMHFRGIMANDLFDESGNYYTIINTGGTILPRVGPISQSDGSRTLSGGDIPNSVNLNFYVGMVYTI